MKLKTVIPSMGMLISLNAMADLPPVAIIEKIQSDVSPITFMDYVSEGRVIKLGESGKLVIGYLISCRRETITGGTVTVGALQSQVSKGQLLREDVECDGGNANLTGQVAASSGALAFRGSNKHVIGVRKIDLTLYGTSPVIRLKQENADVTIERMDESSQQYIFHLDAKHIDLADKNISLELGGIYRVSVNNGASKTFKIDKYAERGKISIVSRLIDL